MGPVLHSLKSETDVAAGTKGRLGSIHASSDGHLGGWREVGGLQKSENLVIRLEAQIMAQFA